MAMDDHQILLMSIRAYLAAVLRPFEEDLKLDQSALVENTRLVMRILERVQDGELAPLDGAKLIRPIIDDSRYFGR